MFSCNIRTKFWQARHVEKVKLKVKKKKLNLTAFQNQLEKVYTKVRLNLVSIHF